jgi:small-conductance mechanosensitive channel
MRSWLEGADVLWALLVVLAVPVAVVVLGEVAERLRQREVPLAGAVTLLRSVVLPLAAGYVILRTLLDRDSGDPIARLVATAAVLTAAVAATIAIRVAVDAIRHRPRTRGRRPPPQVVLALPRLLLVLFTAWLLIDQIWAVDLSRALTALGLGSLIVSFALQPTLSGLASGLLLLGDQPFRTGDWVRVDGIEGRVLDVNWRTTRLVDRNGNVVIFPNAQLASATLVNYDLPSSVTRIVVTLQVAYANPPTRAKEMLLAAARGTPGVLSDPPPRAQISVVDDPLMTYDVHLWIDDYARAPSVRSDFGSLVWYWSERMGVPLPSPAQDLYLWDGPATAAGKVPGREELARRLAVAPALADLPEPELAQLLDGAVARRYARGEPIVRIDADDAALLVLVEGSARLRALGIDGHVRTVLDLGPGEIVAGIGPVAGAAAVEVVAVDDCEVVEVEAHTAGRVVSRVPALAEALEQVGAVRRRRVARLVLAGDDEVVTGITDTARLATEEES